MTTNEILMLLVGFALACGLIALVLVLYPRWQGSQGRFVQAAVESALRPFVAQAIMAAYRLSERQVDQGLTRLRGANKKELADSAYRLLPERIGDYDLRFVKSLISPARFQDLVQDAFDEFDRFYLQNHTQYDLAFKQWLTKNTASAPPTPDKPAAP